MNLVKGIHIAIYISHQSRCFKSAPVKERIVDRKLQIQASSNRDVADRIPLLSPGSRRSTRAELCEHDLKCL